MRRTAVLLTICCVALAGLPARGANAYTAFVTDDCGGYGPQGSVIQYAFGAGSWDAVPQAWLAAGSTTPPRSRAVTALRTWTTWRNRNATPTARVESYHQAGSRVVTVVQTNAPAGDPNAAGFFDCASSTIELNTDLLSDPPSKFSEVASHEMGHALSFLHTGRDDSLHKAGTPPYPLMATCGVTGRGHTNDDVAGLTYFYGVAANKTLSANYGFENGLAFFGASGAQPTLATGSTSGGSYHAMLLPNSSSDNVHQGISHARGHGKYVRPSMQYVTPGATTGGVRMQLYARDVTYTGSPGCAFPIAGRDMNHRVNGSFEYEWVLELDETLPTSNAWRVGTTPYRYYVPFVADANGTENGAVDMRLRVFSSAGTGGGYVHVHYDDLRIGEE